MNQVHMYVGVKHKELFYGHFLPLIELCISKSDIYTYIDYIHCINMHKNFQAKHPRCKNCYHNIAM